METKEKLSTLRASMKQMGLSAYIVPGTDPHASEYVADYWKERNWLSGFTGSAGTVAVTTSKAGLWTDSRYFLQAEAQLKGSGIDLMKEGLAETPSIADWIISELTTDEAVGVNPEMFSAKAYEALKGKFAEANLRLVSIDLIRPLWNDRPQLPTQPLYVLEEQYAGQNVADKLAAVRQEMAKHNADVYVLSSLDEIAWLFNIRGTDVDYNPLVIAYAMVEKNKVTLFIAPSKLTAFSMKYVVENKICVADYEHIVPALHAIGGHDTVMYDGNRLNQALFEAFPVNCKKVDIPSVVMRLKSVKNSVELAGTRRAMLQDGKALVRFFKWLEETVGKERLTEFDIMARLKEFRSEGEHFVGESFGTIAGYQGNGAIVHYSASEKGAAEIKKEGMLLLDSGGQYFDGTTDITRTVTLSEPTAEQKRDYTLVLKGHIALACAKFPKGTCGVQLDILARQFLWQQGLSYGHGTGHGVGHFLCVHEGPQNIRTDLNPTPLEVGMLVSNEPGLYRAGKYGIRIENLVAVKECEVTEFGQFLSFETLTLFPYDQQLIDWSIMTEAEIDWINEYHKMVEEKLLPLLSEEEGAWLKRKCLKH